MSLLSRLFGRRRKPSPATAEQPARPAPSPAPPGDADAAVDATLLSALRRVGQQGGATAEAALRELRLGEGSPAEHPVLAALVAGLRAADGLGLPPAPLEAVRLACASLLQLRGDGRQALELLAHASSVEGMILAADLHAAAGELPRAVCLVERAMALDIDAPGASERHQRWTVQLGRRPRRRATDEGATVVVAEPPQTSFRVLRQIARGGAGTVYEAEDAVLGRRLAFKLYHCPDRDREQVAREARRAVELRGPGVLRIYDADPEHGWIASEWVGRGSLRDALAQGREAELLPLDRWALPLLAAVARVHQAGWVHADLKPANVLLRAPDEPLLADFGLCVPVGAESFAGTPGYLSPERIAGQPAQPRDDVYALGRIIEDVLEAVGRASTHAVAQAALRRWSGIARRCLAPEQHRPADAGAVLGLLARGRHRTHAWWPQVGNAPAPKTGAQR